jgi:hypothetical protein
MVQGMTTTENQTVIPATPTPAPPPPEDDDDDEKANWWEIEDTAYP